MDWHQGGLRNVRDKTFVDLGPVYNRVRFWNNNFDFLLLGDRVPEHPELVRHDAADPLLAPLLLQDLRPVLAVDGLGRGAADGAEDRGYEWVTTVVASTLLPPTRTWRW